MRSKLIINDQIHRKHDLQECLLSPPQLTLEDMSPKWAARLGKERLGKFDIDAITKRDIALVKEIEKWNLKRKIKNSKELFNSIFSKKPSFRLHVPCVGDLLVLIHF